MHRMLWFSYSTGRWGRKNEWGKYWRVRWIEVCSYLIHAFPSSLKNSPIILPSSIPTCNRDITWHHYLFQQRWPDTPFLPAVSNKSQAWNWELLPFKHSYSAITWFSACYLNGGFFWGFFMHSIPPLTIFVKKFCMTLAPTIDWTHWCLPKLYPFLFYTLETVRNSSEK